MFCIACFRSNLYGKFRLAVTSHAMITPTDNILVAFSGGPSSRVALQFVHELQHKSLKNFDASRDRSLPVFRVGVAFIDETTISPLPFHDIDRAIQDIRLINLLDAVSDTTGKEDLLLHLQMSSLQKVASESGYNKIVLGLCTSRITCHVISATVKDSLKIVELLKGPCSGINGLVSSLVRILQEENPSRECTNVRTAGKLTPFHFNRIPESDDSIIPLAT
ncbi:hypothetical protein CMV_001822 [Castanea mollissima]|uniref:Cytoplasmic tRNA 2-thiolation protein 2 n=1 Tax=Castanea mollissima TaxID=60419 RepID=A0A8J4VWM4_9ROSI|nr:hypothetical protein CMV_001822 [Castanea mollissima]